GPDRGAEARFRKVRNLARFPVRALSVDQLYHSVAQATGHQAGPEAAPASPDEPDNTADVAVAALVERGLTVQRSLALLNGDYVHKAVQAGARAAVAVNGVRPGADHVEWLFLTTLSRRPTARESALMLGLLEEARGTRGVAGGLLGLLHSPEFATNH